MRKGSFHTMELNGRHVEYRLIRSETARKLRVRVGLKGVEVVHPSIRDQEELDTFLATHHDWICRELERVDKMRQVRRPSQVTGPEILLLGTPTPITIIKTPGKRINKIVETDGGITIQCGVLSLTRPMVSLENWLRKRAKERIYALLREMSKKVNKKPVKVYVMGQRTKWGNCSSLHNLSFNWRLIMAPEHVIRYLVTHEVVHLEIPDHSKRFWLMVQSLCPEMERARQWLSANGHRLMVDLETIENPAYWDNKNIGNSSNKMRA